MTASEIRWPATRLGEALELLARSAGLPCRTVPGTLAAPDLLAAADQPRLLALARWVEAAATQLGLEAEPVESRYADIPRFLRCASPALLRVHGSPDEFLLLLAARRKRVRLLGTDHRVHELPLAALRDMLCGALDAPLIPALERALATARVPDTARTLRAVLDQQLGTVVIRGFWLLRLPPSAPLGALARNLGLLERVVGLFVLHGIEYALWLLAFWVVGSSLLAGRADVGWFAAFGLLLATTIPFHWWSTRAGGLLAVDAAMLLRQRLLAGALQLDPRTLRTYGAGSVFSKVLEADAVEAMALSGGTVAISAVVELVMVAGVFALGPAPVYTLAALAVSVAVCALVSAAYLRRRMRWTRARLALSDELIGNIVGNRTRVAQAREEHWHDREDALLCDYHAESVGLDRLQTALTVFVPRLVLVLGVLALGPVFVDSQTSAALLAVGLGGVLLALRSLQAMCAGLVDLAGARAAWDQVSQLQAAATQARPASNQTLESITHRARSGPVLEAHRLTYAHRPSGKPVLAECDLSIALGDRVLIEGASGAGKSTLVSVLSGLQAPSSGTLLWTGLDLPTLGLEGWRARVASAPQFQDNHVLSAPFAFNLLMGRRWPPRDGDLEDAELVCRELGLGPLLERMPSGMLQFVGDTGWQLSHGERSRLYIARTILQVADLIILDESFAALDPETLERALRCVLKRAPALIVVAHP